MPLRLRPSLRTARAGLTVAAIAAVLTLPAEATAQPGDVGPACEIDPNSPKALFVVTITMEKAKNAETPEARLEALREAGKALTEKPRDFEKNRAGQQYMLTMLLSQWLSDPAFDPVTTRGAVGFAGEADEPLDLLDALDAAYAGLAEAAPECAAEIPAMRQNASWLTITQKAMADASTDPAGAEALALRSQRMAPASPYASHVLAGIAQQRGESDAAIGHWQRVVEVAGDDTTYTDLRLSSLYYLGMVQAQQAQALEGEAQVAKARAAAEPLAAYLAEKPAGNDAAALMQALFDVYAVAGDSAKMAEVYAPAIAEPARYDDYALTMSGVLATRAGRPADAVALFGAAVEKNPNQRDALRNLAASHYGLDQFAEMLPPVRQLVEIDPNNPDAWSMYAFASQGIANAAEGDERKLWRDSLVFYAGKVDSLPVKVQVAGFQRRADQASLTLVLEGNTETAGSYEVTVEFLDAAGNVVTSATQSVGGLAKGDVRQVQFNGTGEGIAAYRYTPIG